MKTPPSCPICNAPCLLLDTVDFNKSCEDEKGKVLPAAGVAVDYSLCPNCGFCFAPALCAWPLEEFSEKIYNAQYVLVDPDYVDARPRSNAANMTAMLGDKARGLKHLDYGGGGGLMSKLLNEAGWQSRSYDPFVNRDTALESLGQFDLITAFEVFEHVPDAQQLMATLRSLLAPGGVVMFSTLLSDGNIKLGQKLTWWYASPRNGHISLFSRGSLGFLAQEHGFQFGSFSTGFHALFTQVPPWAKHVMGG
jgi:SAM-dependent methyltransferase